MLLAQVRLGVRRGFGLIILYIRLKETVNINHLEKFLKLVNF